MARLSLTFLVLLSLLSLSLARDLPETDNLLPNPDAEFKLYNFFPKLPNPESDETAKLVEVPNPEEEEKREISDLPNSEPEEKPETTETEAVQYIVVPVHQFRDVHNFDNLQGIGFSLRLPMRHHHHHRHHRGGFRHRFGHRFRHGFMPRFAGPGSEMERRPVSMNGDEGRKLEMSEIPEMPLPVHMKKDPEMDALKFDFTSVPMEGEVPMEDEEMESAKHMMKRKRKCKHHHMEKGMMHKHHEHHHGPREEPREEQREEGEEGGFINQLWNLFNF